MQYLESYSWSLHLSRIQFARMVAEFHLLPRSAKWNGRESLTNKGEKNISFIRLENQ